MYKKMQKGCFVEVVDKEADGPNNFPNKPIKTIGQHLIGLQDAIQYPINDANHHTHALAYNWMMNGPMPLL